MTRRFAQQIYGSNQKPEQYIPTIRAPKDKLGCCIIPVNLRVIFIYLFIYLFSGREYTGAGTRDHVRWSTLLPAERSTDAGGAAEARKKYM